jgi:hypothetical protein
MPDNTALVTDAAKDAAQLTLDDYAAGVADHVGGDWGKHNQAQVYAASYNEPVTGSIVSTSYLRLALTQAGVTLVVKIPAIPTSGTPVLGVAPVIYVQPVATTATAGSTATFKVGAASASAMTYQWKKAGVALTGRIADTLVLPSVSASDQADYSVTVSNAYGSATSASVTLTVS